MEEAILEIMLKWIYSANSTDEILKFDAEQTTETEYFYNGEKYLVKTKCHCMKKTCW